LADSVRLEHLIADCTPNATLIRRGFTAFSAADIPTLTEVIAEDAVQHSPGHNVLSGDHQGRDSILTLYGQIGELTGGTYSLTLEEVYANDTEVVTIFRQTATRNGRQLDSRHAMVSQIRDGQTTDIREITADDAADDAFWN
jgi:uncharacterized protein